SAAQDLAAVRQQAQVVSKSFDQFKNAARTSLLDPQAGATSLKSELDNLLREKEHLNSEVNAAQLNMSKSKLALDFLQRELAGLEQEKLHFDLELKKAQSGSSDEFWQELLKQESRLKTDTDILAKDINNIENKLKQHYASEEARQKQLRQKENEFRDLQ